MPRAARARRRRRLGDLICLGLGNGDKRLKIVNLMDCGDGWIREDFKKEGDVTGFDIFPKSKLFRGGTALRTIIHPIRNSFCRRSNSPSWASGLSKSSQGQRRRPPSPQHSPRALLGFFSLFLRDLGGDSQRSAAAVPWGTTTAGTCRRWSKGAAARRRRRQRRRRKIPPPHFLLLLSSQRWGRRRTKTGPSPSRISAPPLQISMSSRSSASPSSPKLPSSSGNSSRIRSRSRSSLSPLQTGALPPPPPLFSSPAGGGRRRSPRRRSGRSSALRLRRGGFFRHPFRAARMEIS